MAVVKWRGGIILELTGSPVEPRAVVQAPFSIAMAFLKAGEGVSDWSASSHS
jgi:hypothetical protein